MKKRILWVLLVLCMVLILLPTAVAAAEGDSPTFTPLEGTPGNSGESYKELLDGKKTDGDFTKWCLDMPSGGAYVIMEASDVVKVTGYTLYTGNDTEGQRNPTDWILYGSNNYGTDDVQWHVIQSVSGDTNLPMANYESHSYAVPDNAAYYKYYKLHITSVRSGNTLQLAELEFTTEQCTHSWGPETTASEATCYAPKYVKKTCSGTCGVTVVFAVGDKTEHNVVDSQCTYCHRYNPVIVGDFIISGKNLTADDYEYEGNLLKIKTATAVEISNIDPTTATTNRIDVESENANITLAGVNIDVSAGSACAFTVTDQCTGTVTITLADNTVNKLTSGSSYAGLQKNSDGSLVIQGDTLGTGSLIATGGPNGAGIGGRWKGSASNITISGGTVKVQGGSSGAGIGGGFNGSASNITISGGTVVAQGGDRGAGIGGGQRGSASNITISGGTVTAKGSLYGAGIGGGVLASGFDIAISGGSVKAIAGDEANAIGGGVNGNGPVTPKNKESGGEDVYLLTIENPDDDYVMIDGELYNPINHKAADSSDSNLYAYVTGKDHTVRVGGKEYKATFNSETKQFTLTENADFRPVYGTDLTISSTEEGTTLRYGFDYTYENNLLKVLSDKKVTIKNGDGVTTTTDRIDVLSQNANITLAGVNIDVSAGSACAFTVTDQCTGTVTITLADNTVNKLTSGSSYAGLQKNSPGSLVIQGDTLGTGGLIAKGNMYGAGIGGGWKGSASNITISGGMVTAQGGPYGAGIGGGYYSTGSNITISGGTVTAKGGLYGAGIGGGAVSSGFDIVISGGSVKAIAGISANAIGGGCDGNGPVTPKNKESGGEDVYLLTIANPDSKTVTIDGTEYTPANHKAADSTDTNLYAYLTGKTHIVKIGDDETHYHFANGQFTEATYNTAYEKNVNSHWHTCTTEGCEITYPVAHRDEKTKDHQCDDCGATISSCSGGTATCKEKAVCTYCGKPYGEVDENNHVGGTEVRDAKDANCTEDGYTGDTYCKGCETKLYDGAPITKLGHIDADKNHVCDRESCKATISTCSGGTATCKEKAVCEYCGEPYGEKNPENHTGQQDWIRDETTHQKIWNCCNTPIAEEADHDWDEGVCRDCGYGCQHTGGQATCHTKAICETCGQPYGDFDPDHHDGGTELRNDKAATCTETGYTGDTHCKGCQVKLETGQEINALGHTGGQATCESPAVCQVCGNPYGEKDPENHTGAKQWTKTETTHKEAWSCCDLVTVEEEAHTFEKDVCTACGQEKQCAGSHYSDLDAESWYHDDVDYVIEQGLMIGYKDGTFKPCEEMTRAELVQVLYNWAGKPDVSITRQFSDVDETNWYARAVSWAVEQGIVKGMGDGTFAPDRAVTREELAAMLYRKAGEPETEGTLEQFSDSADAMNYAVPALKWAVEQGILKGDKKNEAGQILLRPKDGAKRCEVAAMLHRYIG